jgi:hypothetical protein
VLVEDEIAEGQGGGLEGCFGVSCRAVDCGVRVGPAGVGPGGPLEELEGDAEGEADGGEGAVVKDVQRSGFVFGEAGL